MLSVSLSVLFCPSSSSKSWSATNSHTDPAGLDQQLTMLTLKPTPSAIYRLITGQTIPYWLYLRMLHLLSVCTFAPGESTNAFVISSLRADGVDVPEIETVVVVLKNELMLMDAQENALIEALDEQWMKPNYNKIVWSKLRDQIIAVTLPYTVSLSDLAMDPKPVTFGLQLDTSRDDTYPTASQRANLGLSILLRDLLSATTPDSDAVMNDNFDLSCTSVPITEHNYKDFMQSPPSTPIKPADLTADSRMPDNLPDWMWPRVPHLGQPHIDALTGVEMKTVHHPVLDPARFNDWEEDEEEMPLLEFTIDGDIDKQLNDSRSTATSKIADKAYSAVSTAQGRKKEDADLPPFSRFSPERLSFMRLGSGSDGLSEASSPGYSSGPPASSESKSSSSRMRTVRKPEPPETAAGDVAFTRLRPSRSNELLSRVRRLIPNKTPKADPKNKSLASNNTVRSDAVAGTTDKSVDELQPTTDNLLRLFKEGHGLPEIKQMCGFKQTVDDLQVMW